jgi:predicted transcriptional regulator
MGLIRIEGQQNLYRDEETGAIVNTDTSGYSQYIKMKSQKQKQKDEIEQLKSDVSEIKDLLKELINGSKQNNA